MMYIAIISHKSDFVESEENGVHYYHIGSKSDVPNFRFQDYKLVGNWWDLEDINDIIESLGLRPYF